MPSRNTRRSRNTNGHELTRRRNRPYERQRQDTSFHLQQPPGSTAASASNGDATIHGTIPNNDGALAQHREIPGFYYDAERKRYFKIQKNHQAASGAYSATTLSDRKEAVAKTIKAKERQERENRRLNRSKFSRSAIAASLHDREIDWYQRRSRQINASRFLLSKFHGGTVDSSLSQHASTPRILFDADKFLDGPYAERQVNVTFRYDKIEKTLFLSVYRAYARSYAYDICDWIAALDRNNPFDYEAQTRTVPHAASANGFGVVVVALNSMGFHTRAPCLVTPHILSYKSNFITHCPQLGLLNVSRRCRIEKQHDPNRLENWSPARIAYRPGDLTLNGGHEQDALVSFKPTHIVVRHERDSCPHYCKTADDSNNCAAIRPPLMDLDDDHSLEFFQAAHGGYESIRIKSHNKEFVVKTMGSTQSDMLSLEFISTNSWLYGLRNGSISYVDNRNGKQRTRMIIRHPGSVTNIVALKKPYIIVNGIPDCMFLYDARSLSDKSPRCEPILRYDHHNSKYPSLDMGFDVCESLDLVAASQDDGTIKVFSISTGETLQVLSSPLSEKEVSIPFRTIQIVEEELGFCRILAARYNKIFDFAIRYD
jgi:hypothetical protein